MKRILIIIAIIFAVAGGIYFIGNGSGGENSETTNEQIAKPTYQKIAPAKAKEIMDGEEEFVLLDVRSDSEFEDLHILGATLIPENEIGERAETELPDKNATILVYCRSGGRSARAAQTLVDMGYKNIYDIGGIIDWPYDVVGERE